MIIQSYVCPPSVAGVYTVLTFTTDNYGRGDKSGRRRIFGTGHNSIRISTPLGYVFVMAFCSGPADKLSVSRCLESTHTHTHTHTADESTS